MNSINYSVNIKLSRRYKYELNIILSKLKSESFADEIKYAFKYFGRSFCCIFIKEDSFSEEFCWHVKYLSMLANDVS